MSRAWSRTLHRAARLSLCAAGLLVPARGTVADDLARLTLDEVVVATLRSNPDILLSAQQAEIARGTLLAASSSFDLNLQSSAVGARLHGSDPAGAEALQKQLSYSVGVQRLFRNGLTLRPDVALTRSAFDTFPGSATSNNASLAVSASLPLLRDRGGASSASSERAARHDYAASRLALRHTTALRVLTAVTAYWDYLSAQAREAVLADSERRAERTAEQTRVLVEADERTQADLTQILANLASKRVARIAAEQTLVEGRQTLGLSIGLPAESIEALPEAGTPFPDPPSGATFAPTPAVFAEAFGQRDDLAAAEEDQRSVDALLVGARSDLKPRLDLGLTTGYKAVDGGLGLSQFFAPLWNQRPRLDATLQLSFQFPPANSRARGRLLQSAGAVEQQRIVTDDLRRRIATGVSVAAQALARGAAGVRESEEAVRLSQATVQAEERKFQLGVSTLFDVIQAEDGLTSALLNQILSRRNYAVAIATLRFQSGRLVEGAREETPSVPVQSLLTPP